MFKDFGSENLIKDLCLALTGQIYLPQDYIILKDTIGAEMYFIVEGSVHVIAADKITVAKTLSKRNLIFWQRIQALVIFLCFYECIKY